VIDPSEVQALEEALARLEVAYVDAVQAARRLLLLLRPAAPVVAPPPATSPTGELCRCGGWLVQTGRCLTCQACGQQSGGCG
jgi:hypothetical protein